MSQAENQAHQGDHSPGTELPAHPQGDPGAPQASDFLPDDGASPTGRELWAAARTPRMIGLFVVLMLAAIVCIRLGAWQLDRAALRGAEKAEAAHAEKIVRDPLPLAQVMRVGQEMTETEHSTPVCVSGEFLPEQIAVLDRGVGSTSAVLVAAGLRIAEGPDTGAILPVVRGWMPDPAVRTDHGADAVGPLILPPISAELAREHTVCGYLVGPERAESAPEDGVTTTISPAAFISVWGSPMFGGYLAQSYAMGGDEPLPPRGLDQLPPPRLPGEHGVNVQNLAYAIEWVIFAGFAIGLWFKMVRDEARNRREDAVLARLAAAEAGAPAADPAAEDLND